ncbi:efflux RND transporter periplasmic adaptor subunit [Mangrovimonas xylaniphaga]|uniref:efflux RND transporter periplasmic adaptor subunit n=1 Tax=Mangrovimonas xylaniphaga TaxID=1645915 RepID=UPI0006B503C8|nr:efflux RND transporter periplasmic adaptor subunit [Mangrovimonas xylaniphaga]
MKTLYTLSIVAVTALFMSCGSKDAKQESQKGPAVAVTVSPIKADGNSTFLSVSGKVQAVNSADLSTRFMGYVNSVPVKVGDQVRKGQLLVAINNSDLEAKRAQINAGITQATAAFKNAEKDYNRYKNLFAQNSATQKEFDDITARYDMAAANLEAAKQQKNEINAQMAYTNITAPFNGVVTATTVKAGDMANPGMPLVSVEGPGNFEVIAMVPESDISKVAKNQKVEVLVKATNKTYEGNVTEVSTSAKHTGGQYVVKIALPKADDKILSGMFATVQFPMEGTTQKQMVLLPTSAIVTKGQLTGVYTVSQNNTAVLRWLRLGRTYGDQVEVLSGLDSSETYIVSAEGKLYNGASITIK